MPSPSKKTHRSVVLPQLPPEGAWGMRFWFMVGVVEPLVAFLYGVGQSFFPYFQRAACATAAATSKATSTCLQSPTVSFLLHTGGGATMVLAVALLLVLRNRSDRWQCLAISVVLSLGHIPYWTQPPFYSDMSDEGRSHMHADLALLFTRLMYLVTIITGW
eukprot:m.151086 g.151086  ORF g.151086 m.151086 type:complete len:161 (+) comp17399_c1_seq5:555-1037(+)